MPSPLVESVSPYSFTADATAHVCDPLPTLANGDLLEAWVVNDGDATVATPEGWEARTSAADGTQVRLSVFVRKSDGSDSGGTVDFVTSGAERATIQIYRVLAAQWSGVLADVLVGTAESRSTLPVATPNPPGLIGPDGAQDYLWIAAGGVDGNKSFTAGPTDYTDLVNTSQGAGTGCAVGTARRELNAASEDPDGFTLSANDDWVAMLSVIPPAEVGGGTNYDETGKLITVASTLNASDQADFNQDIQIVVAATLNVTALLGMEEDSVITMAVTLAGSDFLFMAEDTNVTMIVTLVGADQMNANESLSISVIMLLVGTDRADFNDFQSFTIVSSLTGTDVVGDNQENLGIVISSTLIGIDSMDVNEMLNINVSSVLTGVDSLTSDENLLFTIASNITGTNLLTMTEDNLVTIASTLSGTGILGFTDSGLILVTSSLLGSDLMQVLEILQILINAELIVFDSLLGDQGASRVRYQAKIGSYSRNSITRIKSRSKL